MILRSSIDHISRRTNCRAFLITFLLSSNLYLFFFYLKNIIIASSSCSGVIIELDGLLRDENAIKMTGREIDHARRNRGFKKDGDSYIKEEEDRDNTTFLTVSLTVSHAVSFSSFSS